MNASITATVSGFPADTGVTLRWNNTVLVEGITGADGTAFLRFRVPAAPQGSYTIMVEGGGGSATASFELAPRIKLMPGAGEPGETINFSLRGYAAREQVRIRWQDGGSWEWFDVAVTTSGTGSANVYLPVPERAAGDYKVRGDGEIARAQTTFTVNAPVRTATPTPTPVYEPAVVLSRTRSTVNVWVTATLSGYPANQPVSLTWDGKPLGDGMTGSDGTVAIRFRVPAAPIGDHTVRGDAGGASASAIFTMAPRVKVIPGEGAVGDEVKVSLRGFAARETVRIRWQDGDGWEWFDAVVTSSTGSAHVYMPVPNRPDGSVLVRGDGEIARAQTSFLVIGGIGVASVVETLTPESDSESASPTPDALTPEPAATEAPGASPVPEPTEPTETPVPTAEPTAEPTPIPTNAPTETVTPDAPPLEPTVEPSPTPAEPEDAVDPPENSGGD